MEQLYPRNILERHYPILREQREREEREEEREESRQELEYASTFGLRSAVLHENDPIEGGSIGSYLNTIA